MDLLTYYKTIGYQNPHSSSTSIAYGLHSPLEVNWNPKYKEIHPQHPFPNHLDSNWNGHPPKLLTATMVILFHSHQKVWNVGWRVKEFLVWMALLAYFKFIGKMEKKKNLPFTLIWKHSPHFFFFSHKTSFSPAMDPQCH